MMIGKEEKNRKKTQEKIKDLFELWTRKIQEKKIVPTLIF